MSSSTITVRWLGNERQFPPTRPVTIGRGRDCDVVLESDVVSRRHGHLAPGQDGWAYVDDASSRGSWANGERVSRLELSRTTSLVLGQGDGAVVLELVPADGRETVLGAAGQATVLPAASAAGAAAATEGPASRRSAGRQAPGGAGAPPTVLAHQRLTVEAEGRTYVLYPGQSARFGREDADIVLSEPSVSRKHAEVHFRDGVWVFRDAGSALGSHLRGSRVHEVRVVGRMELVLGDAATGARVALATGATTQDARSQGGPSDRLGPSPQGPPDKRRSRAWLVPALIAAVAVIAVAVAAAVFSGVLRGGGADSDLLARATVRVLTEDGVGSGTIVDAERGLILTNAHVAAPRATGRAVAVGSPVSALPETPRQIIVAVSPGLDRAAENRFRAKVVAADGYVDLVVLQLTNNLSGTLVTPSDLEGLAEVEIGDSDDLDTGTPMTVLGYPPIAASAASTLTRGVVSGTVADARLGTNRAYINLDAQIRGGNSGGLAADEDGRLLGVPTLDRLPGRDEEGGYEDLNEVASMRPINLAKPLIEAARSGTPYRPDHLTEWPDGVDVKKMAFVEPRRAGFEASCDARPVAPTGGDAALAVTLEYSGLPAAEHVDVLVVLSSLPAGSALGAAGDAAPTQAPQPLTRAETSEFYPFAPERDGCLTATLALEDGLAPGAYLVEVFGGPDYEQLGRTSFDVR